MHHLPARILTILLTIAALLLIIGAASDDADSRVPAPQIPPYIHHNLKP